MFVPLGISLNVILSIFPLCHPEHFPALSS